jgi:hypothetical protein
VNNGLKIGGRKRLRPDLRYYPGICLEKLINIIKPAVRIAGFRAEILNQNTLNTKESAGTSTWALFDNRPWLLRETIPGANAAKTLMFVPQYTLFFRGLNQLYFRLAILFNSPHGGGLE